MENSQDEIQAKLKPSILLEVALEEADEKDRDETSWEGTLAIFIESGRSEIEHHIWRENKLAPLSTAWLQLVDAKVNQNPASHGMVGLENEWGEEEQYERLEFIPIRSSRAQIELDIAKWYLRNLESNNFAYPGCENDSMQELGPEVAYLLRTFGTPPPAEARIDDKTNPLEEREEAKSKRIRNINKKVEQKRYIKLSLDDLEEKHDLTREEVVKHAYPNQCNSGNAHKQKAEELFLQRIKGLSDQAFRAKRNYKKLNDGKLELPIRLYTKRGGAWDKYALTYEGRSGEGNKYGIIKADQPTDKS